MPNSGSDPGDSNSMLSLSIDRLSCLCRCGCEHEHEHGHGHGSLFGRGFPGHSQHAHEERARFLDALLGQSRALLGTAREALAAGATTADEILDMQRLEIWFARLVAEKAEGERPPPRPKKPRR
jgi:hypothetical protein